MNQTDPRISVRQEYVMGEIERALAEKDAEIERLRTDLARAHWETREQERVNSELQATLETYASTASWNGRMWTGEYNGWVLAQRALASGQSELK